MACHRDFIRKPAPRQEVQEVHQGFHEITGIPIWILGLVDGTLIPISNPSVLDQAFISRKGYAAIDVLGGGRSGLAAPVIALSGPIPRWDSARGKPTSYSATVLFDAHFECQSVKPKLYSSPLFCPRASYLSVPMANCVFRAPARFRSDRFSATGFVSCAKSRHGDANGHTAHGKTRAVTFEARGADR
ncbi:unnamed protein product [Boreogadus saida]